MKVLAISTSSNNASVALLEDTKCLKELNICNERTHSEKLMPLIDELFHITGFSLSDIGLIACDIGPGSFTGIRIGVATVKALSLVNNVPVVGCSSLEGLAYNVTGSNYICSLIDARNNQIYSAIFDKNYSLVTDYLSDDINALLPTFEKYPDMAFVGDGVKLLGKEAIFDEFIHSANIGICGYSKHVAGLSYNADKLVPLYLKKSQAERLKNG